MGTDRLYIVDTSKLPAGLSGRELELACWNARISLGEVHHDYPDIREHDLDFYASWNGVFLCGPNPLAFETILFKDADGHALDEPLLGLLDTHHLDAMIASIEANRSFVEVGTADDQLRALKAVRDACRENPNIRAAYQVDY